MGTDEHPRMVPSITVTGTAAKEAWREHLLPPVEQVRKDVWSIPTIFPNNPLRYVNIYAIEHDGGVALIDAGWPDEEGWDALLAGLKTAGFDITDVKAVLVSHGHADHYGMANRIRERSGAWVAMHELDVDRERIFVEGRGTNLHEEWIRQRGNTEPSGPPPERMPGMFESFHLDKVDRLLVDREFPLGPGSGLMAIWTPGHTPGHTCFADTDRGLVFTGDHVLPRITPNISPSPLETDDTLGQFLESLKMLGEVAKGEVLPAHEYRFNGLWERVEQLRYHHQLRLGEVMAALHAQPGATSMIVAEALHWSRPWSQMVGPPRRFAVGETYSHLLHLEATGYATNRGEDVDAWFALRDDEPRLTDYTEAATTPVISPSA